MNLPLMPKATAVWLVDNTTLDFNQIAEFCGLHPLEVQGIADGDVATGIMGVSPVEKDLLTQENLDEAQADKNVPLKLCVGVSGYITSQKKQKKNYTPVARRQDKPDAIAWVTKNHADITDAQIAKLIGSTKSTIAAIRSKEHWNIQNIKPRDPVLLGLCTQTDLHAAIKRADEVKLREAEKIEKEQLKKEKEKAKKKAEKAAAKKEAAASKIEKQEAS